MDAPIHLRLLGTPQITFNGQPVHGFESRKALALFCYLALHSEPVSRTHLADLFWGDKPEAKGRGNLSRVLHNLNQLFPNSLVATRDTLQLKSDSFLVDTHAFEQYAAQAIPEALAAAAALYRDEFMAGLYLDDCPDFELWLVQERERWRQRIVSVLESLSNAYTRRGEYATALPFAARLLDIEPWREEAHREMMRLLAQTGQRSAALQQYETARRVLAQELNVEPGAETNALYGQIRAKAIAPNVNSPHNLPTQLTLFFGRETDLTRITARLNNPDCRLLTLVGAGGIGKTRLGLEAAKNLLTSFRDGVYFVPLAPLQVGRIDFIVPAIANALSFAFAGNPEPKTQLLNFLRTKQILLLLDNFEHLLGGTALVIEILQSAPNVKILVTSREPLNVQAEWLLRVQGLSYPTNALQQSEGITHYSAVQLFAERASRVDEHFSMDAETNASVVRICQIVEGMPLAIELAATAIKWMTVRTVAEQISHNLDVLMTPLHDMDMRHQSLRAVLDWSYALLSEKEQTLFRRAAVFTGGWTLEAAVAVCTGEGLETTPVVQLSNNLMDKSLVLREELDGETRYRMLEPVRQYGYEKLRHTGETQLLNRRHLDFFLKLAETESQSDVEDQQMSLNYLKSEYANLRSAFDSAAVIFAKSWIEGHNMPAEEANVYTLNDSNLNAED